MNEYSKLDELLAWAIPELNKEADALDEAPPVPVPDELKARILQRAETFSAEQLATLVLEAAEVRGVTREALIAEAPGAEATASEVLSGRTDPQKLGAATFNPILERAGIDPKEIREYVAQAVAQFFTAPPRTKRPKLLRSLGGSKSYAYNVERPSRDPKRARAAGLSFADQVIAEHETSE